MNYVVLFDLTREGFTNWGDAVFPAVVIIIGAVSAFFLNKIPEDKRDNRDSMLLAMGIALPPVLLVVVGLILYNGVREYSGLRNRMETGNVRVTAGVVTAFKPEPSDGHPWGEAFTVNGVEFKYTHHDFSAAFHKTHWQRGPVRDGLPVRITDVDGKIVKLEADTSRQ